MTSILPPLNTHLNAKPVTLKKMGPEIVIRRLQQSTSRGLSWGKIPFKLKVSLLALALGTMPALIVGSIEQGLIDKSLQSATFTAPQREQIRSMREKSLMAAGLVSLLGGGLGLYMAHRFSKPINQAIKTLGENGGPSQHQLSLLKTVADRAVAFKEAENIQTRVLVDIGRAKTEAEVDGLLKRLLAGVRDTLGVDRLVIYKLNADKTGYIACESVAQGWKSAYLQEIKDNCIGEELLDRYRQGRVVATADVYRAGFHPAHLGLMESLQIKANLVAPIVKDNLLYGLIIAHHCHRPHEWQPQEINYLTAMGKQIGFALTGGLAEEISRENSARREKMARLLEKIEHLSRGDLKVRAEIEEGDTGVLANLFNAIADNLSGIVDRVSDSAREVNHSLGEQEREILELAQATRLQAERIKKTLSYGEKMAFSSQKVASKARKAAQVARNASATAQISGETIEKTVMTNLQLRNTVAETAKKMKQLGESSQQISKVVGLINHISVKTNLLAVNASIEAARAGEEGRGFAIVAEQVGQLAAQSGNATREIEQIVDAILKETSEVLKAMEISTNQVVEETRLVEETKNNLGQIVQISQQIDLLFQSISEETESQTNIAHNISGLMQEIGKISQQTADSYAHVGKSLQETVSITRILEDSVQQFKVEPKNQ